MSDLLNSASLVMIPSGYKEDVVYSQIPTDGSGDLSFTRASNGTRINSAGLVEVCPWNLLEYSEQFNNGYWGKDGGVSVSANTTTAPNGTTTAETISYNGTPNISLYKSAIAGLSGAYTISFYIKAPSGQENKTINFRMFSSQVNQNITLTNEWVRYEFTTTAGANNDFEWGVKSSATATSIYLWGAQLNIGSTAKPYLPTTDRLNVPRLAYQNGGGGCPSLLLEKQSTNLALWSEDFTNAIWTKNNATISANATTSPDGTSNADKIIPDTNLGAHSLYQSITVTATTYAMSFYAKRAGYTGIRVANLATGVGARFDLLNGVLGTVSAGVTASIENVGNDWYRCIISFTPTAGANLYGFYVDQQVNVSSYAGNGTDGIFVWGAQLEASSYPTSYIPSTSSSATRVADACYKTGISSLIGQSEGSLFAQVSIQSGAEGSRAIAVQGGSDRIGITVDGTSVGFFIVNSGGVVYSSATSITWQATNKLAVAYKSGNSTLYVNGVAVLTTSASFTLGGAMANLYLGQYEFAPGTGQNGQRQSQAILFPTRLTNAELALLTSL